MDEFFKLWLPIGVAIVSLVINIVQWFGYRRVRNKISVWAKDAKGMVTSIVGIQKNIKTKKISSLDDATSNLDTLANFSNSMFTSMEEELGRKTREIKIKKKKRKKNNDFL